MSFSLIIFNF